MVVKEFVLSYARYRRLGFSGADALDFALTRPAVKPITAARARRPSTSTARSIGAHAQLRVIK
jgi:hypothetical protein